MIEIPFEKAANNIVDCLQCLVAPNGSTISNSEANAILDTRRKYPLIIPADKESADKVLAQYPSCFLTGQNTLFGVNRIIGNLARILVRADEDVSLYLIAQLSSLSAQAAKDRGFEPIVNLSRILVGTFVILHNSQTHNARERVSDACLAKLVSLNAKHPSLANPKLFTKYRALSQVDLSALSAQLRRISTNIQEKPECSLALQKEFCTGCARLLAAVYFEKFDQLIACLTRNSVDYFSKGLLANLANEHPAKLLERCANPDAADQHKCLVMALLEAPSLNLQNLDQRFAPDGKYQEHKLLATARALDGLNYFLPFLVERLELQRDRGHDYSPSVSSFSALYARNGLLRNTDVMARLQTDFRVLLRNLADVAQFFRLNTSELEDTSRALIAGMRGDLNLSNQEPAAQTATIICPNIVEWQGKQ